MKKFTFLKGFLSLFLLVAFTVTKLSAQTASLSPLTPTVIVGAPVTMTATATGFCGSQRHYTWTAVGASPASVVTQPDVNTDAQNFTFAATGTYTITVQIFRTGGCGSQSSTVSTTVTVIAAPASANLWATSNNGTQVSTFKVSGNAWVAAPANLFVPSFTGTNTGGTSTAALGRSDKPSQAAGYFYWLPNTSGNGGIVEVFGSNAAGTTQAMIGSLNFNTPSSASLGFVRLAVDGFGTAWILASGGGALYLAKFKPNALTANTSLPVADQLVVVDASVALVGGAVATFQNGDICFDGSGTMVALANNAGVTQIFVGAPNGPNTSLTKKFDVLDENSAAFSGSVNGVAFDIPGSLFVSAADGLYYINKSTVNGPAATISISQVWSGTGLQDLATNFFPTTIITPVKLGTFEVIKTGNNAVLNWTTLTEDNSDHFEIERSLDGINFTTVGSKQAAGLSSDVKSYQYIDPINTNAKIIYYRLKTLDVDAKYSVSKIVALRLNGLTVKSFTAYPNPFTSDLKVQISSNKESTITIRINNALGQPVVNRKVVVQSGENIVVLSSEIATLKAGMYMMEVVTDEEKFTQKIIKR